jgi:hypothetical protein
VIGTERIRLKTGPGRLEQRWVRFLTRTTGDTRTLVTVKGHPRGNVCRAGGKAEFGLWFY